ncbi:MAG: SMC-Scp complex subunit ScpB [Candidatus Taylorbacteria bacterium]|nr:SMC-Scp complex subunit ScpB [Candidatus Taylorbacteria bacterium]
MTQQLPLNTRIESLLFWKAEPMTLKKVAEALDVSLDEVKAAIVTLREQLNGRGITLIEFNDEVTLGTARSMSEDIEKWTKEELSRDLGKAGLETLAIILYQGPISRADIDYIRGVNSTFILRNLLIRGLVEKVSNPKDQRSFLYQTTLELLSHLGISKLDELPDLEKVTTTIAAFKAGTDTTTPPEPQQP